MENSDPHPIATTDMDLEEIASDEIAELLSDELKTMQDMGAANFIESISNEEAELSALGGINYPYTCYRVQGQSEPACKLTAPSDLPNNIKHIYKIDHGLSNLFATKKALLTGVQACVYSVNGKSGTVTVSGMSSMRFSNTRPSNPTSPHNKGKAFDVKLQGRMKSNGSNYDQIACAYLCLYCVEAGSTRVYFSDQKVIDAVNKTTGKKVCEYLGGHENHIHLHNYS